MGTLLKATADDAFVIQPSDTDLIKIDSNNTDKVPVVYVKNNTDTAGSVKVLTARGAEITLFIQPGMIDPLPVKKVFATPAPPASLLGYY